MFSSLGRVHGPLSLQRSPVTSAITIYGLTFPMNWVSSHIGLFGSSSR
jgi:hypothetical protein